MGIMRQHYFDSVTRPNCNSFPLLPKLTMNHSAILLQTFFQIKYLINNTN